MQSGDDEVGNSRARSSSVDRQRIIRQMLDVYTVEKDTNVRQINQSHISVQKTVVMA